MYSTVKMQSVRDSDLELILLLSHKSGALYLYEPLPVSDAPGDDFFEIFGVFLVETFFFS